MITPNQTMPVIKIRLKPGPWSVVRAAHRLVRIAKDNNARVTIDTGNPLWQATLWPECFVGSVIEHLERAQYK